MGAWHLAQKQTKEIKAFTVHNNSVEDAKDNSLPEAPHTQTSTSSLTPTDLWNTNFESSGPATPVRKTFPLEKEKEHTHTCKESSYNTWLSQLGLHQISKAAQREGQMPTRRKQTDKWNNIPYVGAILRSLPRRLTLSHLSSSDLNK